MGSKDRWLASRWPTIRSHLPAPPARVVEIGCGSLGGFIPALHRDGYEALGIDPQAPEGDGYQRVEFERVELSTQVDAVIACTSLHHVAEPSDVLDKVAEMLVPDGVMIVVEWDWQSFDEATADWCFERLDGSGGWLYHRRNEWISSRQPWRHYLEAWAAGHRIHGARSLLEELDRRFDRHVCDRGAYFFPDLLKTTEADELDAITSGQIKATRIDYVGKARGDKLPSERP